MSAFLSQRRFALLKNYAWLFFCGWIAACDVSPSADRQAVSGNIAKSVSFAVLEDYDKNQDLKEIAKDFQLMKELGIDVLRCSLGWDDYEPAQGQYDFGWLKDFVRLAAQHGIKLRPYIGYTPRWAAAAGSADGMDWNNPPADYRDWYRFVYQLAYSLRDYPNVLSYEIYNEQNAPLWWDGSIAQYKEALRHAALAVRTADPDAQVILGGFVLPDVDWLRSITQSGHARYYDITPFHAYPETWTSSDVVVENYLDARYREFVRDNKTLGEAEPIWINEMGFATTPGKSELDQANWWARAVSTFLADPYIEHIGVYEIKDLPLGKESIGDEKNHYLGLTRADRTKKLAFHTVALLRNLLATGKITPADGELTVTVSNGKAGELHSHLFRRPDGKQVLFLYDKSGDPTIRVSLRNPGQTAVKYQLDGTSTNYASFDGRTLYNIKLTGGNVAIFRIDPQ
jgi:hypothetical protein